MTPTQRNTRRL